MGIFSSWTKYNLMSEGGEPVVRRRTPSSFRRLRAGWRARIVERLYNSRLARQIVVSAAIFLLVFTIHAIPLAPFRALDQLIWKAINTPYDFAGTLRRATDVEVWADLADRYGLNVPFLNQSSSADETVQGSSVGELLMPVNGEITSAFGWRDHPITGQRELHEGLDISAPEGTPVLAAAGGVVRVVRKDEEYGKVIEIDHGGGLISIYAHLREVFVLADQEVKQGDVIGEVGMTGNVTAPHLHFEVRQNGLAINPASLFAPANE